MIIMSSEQPLFSVLIANYNNGRYLMGAVESIFRQSYKNWEIVLVDDCSVDNSEEIYKVLEKDARIRVFRNERNMGCGYTKRRCVENSRGELCGFLDPDDEILPDALQVMVETHQAHPEVSLVTSRYYFCDENLKPYRESRPLVIPEGKDFFTMAAYTAEVFSAFKRSCYDKTDGISPRYHLGVDQDLYFKLEEIAPIYPINNLTYKYRIYNGSISSNELRARYWNMIIHHDVCLRRGLNPDEYSFKDMLIIKNYCQDQVRNSAPYRLGRALLAPVYFIKTIFHNKS
jgi:glycosyltransferase involved in cell wall biosynthesis